jgi:hypothetical protein
MVGVHGPPETTDITVIRRDRLGEAIHEYRQVV